MKQEEDITKLKIIPIIAKPNSKETKLIGFDKEKQSFKVEVKAPADKNKANLEIIKFFSKLLKKKVRIKSGLTSKEKLLEVE